MTLYSVVTGDLVKSGEYIGDRRAVLEALAGIFHLLIEKKPEQVDVWTSDVYGGDSFQIVVSDARYALLSALYLRAQLVHRSTEKMKLDARTSIGIGTVEYLNRKKITESDGEAFRLSGRAVAEIPRYRRLAISSPDRRLNAVLEVIAAFLDAVTSRWTPQQAEAISHWIFGETQTSLARLLGISQPAVQQRLQLAGHFAVDACLKRFNEIVGTYMSGNL